MKKKPEKRSPGRPGKFKDGAVTWSFRLPARKELFDKAYAEIHRLLEKYADK